MQGLIFQHEGNCHFDVTCPQSRGAANVAAKSRTQVLTPCVVTIKGQSDQVIIFDPPSTTHSCFD